MLGLTPDTDAYAAALRDWCRYYGIPIRITEGKRSWWRQSKLYAQGRILPGPIVTNAPPGTSIHESGRAFDVAIVGARPYDPQLMQYVGQIGKALGLKWGGDFKNLDDTPHFELT